MHSLITRCSVIVLLVACSLCGLPAPRLELAVALRARRNIFCDKCALLPYLQAVHCILGQQHGRPQ